jgi:hypothetical protein
VLVLEPGRNFRIRSPRCKKEKTSFPPCAQLTIVCFRETSRFGAGISSARIGREKGSLDLPGPMLYDPCAKMCSTRLEFPRGWETWEESFSTRTACMQGMAIHAALLETSVCCERSRVVVYRRRSFEPSF